MMAKFILKALKNAEVYESDYFVPDSQVSHNPLLQLVKL
jgi:hypothetical protein